MNAIETNLNILINSNNNSKVMDVVINNKYKIEELLGEGSFGKIFQASNILTGEKVAIKIEKKQDKCLLKFEANILIRCKEIKGVPRLKSFGVDQNYNYMVVEILGRSLEDLKDGYGDKLKLYTVLNIGLQILTTLESLHGIGIIHRDLKPENILIGTGKAVNNFYLIDFGLSKYFIDQDRNHKPLVTGKKLTGTLRYSSLNVQSGIECSRRDDLESLGYIFIHILKGALPWENIKGETKEQKYDIIMAMKRDINIFELCSGMPLEFAIYLNYCRGLGYDETPDYGYLKGLFQNLLNYIVKKDKIDCCFEWL